MPSELPALDCWFLTGVTATGKTRIALALAERLNAEIISLDSMAIYRGMDVGTAKPTPEQQAAVPHHLIDVVDADEDYSVAQYVDAAHAKIAEIRGRGREVLFVGGTPLYLKALLRGLFEGPPANWELRQEIEREVAEVGNEALHARLEQIDPIAASAIHPRDTRRLIRALEVFRATGQPISHQQMEFDDSRKAEDCRVFVLRRPKEEQNARINERVEEMVERGLIEEVERLTAGGLQLGRTASQAVGYREVIEFLAGERDRASMLERIKTRTRQFAKRQGVWFRSLSECRFVDIEGDVDAEVVADQIASLAPGQ
ncbi:tRNA (adenosine(37)-N6)-dimethylallyltransferase MiaA [Lacipirellula sp.]|uniref:tRNA (adenosine(37)-N6)-dimethylallyltransferase MiaA n=1 Tax=Lacipirellula sp. TaxID=2691419 RepID=UPI003D151697